MAMRTVVELRTDHICNCGACIEIPKFFLEEKDVSLLLGHHTCGCDACIENLKMITSKVEFSLRTDHTCGCNACTVNQSALHKA